MLFADWKNTYYWLRYGRFKLYVLISTMHLIVHPLLNIYKQTVITFELHPNNLLMPDGNTIVNPDLKWPSCYSWIAMQQPTDYAAVSL